MPKRGNKGQRSIARQVSKANVSLQSIASVLDQQTQQIQQIQQTSAVVEDNKGGGSTSAQLVAIQVARAQLQYQKDSNNFLKSISMAQNKQIEVLQKGNKDWKSFGDKFKDFKIKMADAFDPTTIKKKLLGPFTMFKGVRDKIEDMDYIKRARALGDKRDKKDIKADAIASRSAKEDALRAQDKIDRLRRLGANERQINSSDAMKQRTAALNKFNSLNSGVPSGKSARDAANKMGGNTAGVSAPMPVPDAANKMGGNVSQDTGVQSLQAHETQIEQLKNLQQQTDLLSQIAANTALMAGVKSSAAGGSEDTAGANSANSGRGFLGKLGSGLSSLGQGLGRAVGGVISGIFEGLATGLAALAKPLTLVGLAALTLAIMGIGKALQWAAPVFQTFGDVAMKIADVIQNVFLGAIKAIPDIINGIANGIVSAIGAISDLIVKTIDAVTSSIERLSKLDGSNMLDVAKGLTAIGLSLIAFGTGEVFAGLTGLITNLLSFGQDSPMDKLDKLSKMGDGLQKSADSINNIGQAMKAFAGIDPKSMDAINNFPWVKATAFVAAGGAMSVAGAKVYDASKGNADNAAKNSTMAPASNITTQVNNSSNTTQAVKGSGARNTESSYSKYLSARY